MRSSDCCDWPGVTTPECLEFNIGEEVETPFTGVWTRHRIVGRFRTKFSQSKVVYILDPPVHPATKVLGGKIDAAWFRRPTETVPAGSR